MKPRLNAAFPRVEAPGTGRPALQLTSGPAYSYPLYYYIPSITRDGRYLVHHVARDGEVQLHRLDLETGASAPITRATATETWWRPWCSDPGRGVLDHRSVLDVARDAVIYFDGDACRAVEVTSGAARTLFELPHERLPIGQNCVTPDGRWFVFIHADRERYERTFEGDPDFEAWWRRREQCRDTRLVAVDLQSGAHRTLLVMSSPLHHVMPYGERHLLFCHPTAEEGMLLTDLEGGWYDHLRTQDETGGQVCHFVATRRGAMYEVLKGAGPARAGICDPITRRTWEVPLPEDFGYVHTGRDPDGLLWLFENHAAVHDLWFLERYDPGVGETWRPLTGDWPTYGDPDAQKAHFHPQVVLDGGWVLLTAGDPSSGTNQLYLLDIGDLAATAGVPDVRPTSRRIDAAESAYI